MHDLPFVRNVVFRPASRLQMERGVVAWAQFECCGLVLKGVEVRRMRNGELGLGFPPVRVVDDQVVCGTFPANEDARRALEEQVAALLDRGGAL